ncbi:MAG TPA: glycosyltransferase [Candidatus Acidoferrales bacterium]|nr:glycosyltransferase [Candidatus Acidoferrales bacterium]
MVTYNHEKFINSAIESVISQRVGFRYELVIGEDCSTDRTREIVKSYEARNQHLIRTQLHSQNQGAQECFLQALWACRGRYVAILEGDDYWTSPHKLQTQVDILERHPEFSICCHRAKVIYENGNQEPWEYPMLDRTVLTLEDLLRENFIPTCSTMFRLGLLIDIPEWYRKVIVADWALHLLLAQYGDIALIPETMSVYRVHGGGSWSKLDASTMARHRLGLFRQLEGYLPAQYTGLIRELCARYGKESEGRLV